MTTATLSPPDWLTLRQGSLKPHYDGQSWAVIFDDEPQYLLTPVPAKGKHAVRIKQTINGKPILCDEVYPSDQAALSGGLETLRKSLGW
ncbi:MAG: hypothetical protein JNM56_30565 [Planctomycetia bacterium]|nr:hypothetical protein [Planctomycetia bacterium]